MSKQNGAKTTSIPDSGTRYVYNTGAQRDNRSGKGRYDLISPFFMHRLALRLEQGAEKYSERNWEMGMDLGRYLDAAMRHLSQLLLGERYTLLDEEGKPIYEDHAAAVAFNIMAFIHTEEMISRGVLSEDLDDLPDYKATNYVTKEAEDGRYLLVGKEGELEMDVEMRMLWVVKRETQRYKEARKAKVKRILYDIHGSHKRLLATYKEEMPDDDIKHTIKVNEEPSLVQYVEERHFYSARDYVADAVLESVERSLLRMQDHLFAYGYSEAELMEIWEEAV